ncbi:MAG: DUF2784 domain-containing protein [Rubrivivax sp.]|nr:DUF2784 domain-containing protein [Rubrivivax sp.]
MYAWLADAVLLLHLAVVIFVIGGWLAIIVGGLRGWAWTARWRFRLLHLAAIGTVVLQAWLGQVCPLTTLESWLRIQAGQSAYETGFIQHWVHALMFYQAPAWIFTAAYTGFAAAVLLAWWRFPPRSG